MSKEKNTESTIEKGENRIYELGFHFVPTMSDDEAMVQFSHLKSLVEKQGGVFISEEAPVMTDLSYEIAKTVKAQKKRYTTSYFGWVKFEIDPASIPALEKTVKLFEPLLRYIVISTVRENTLSGIKDLSKDSAKDSTKDGKTKVEDATSEVSTTPETSAKIDEVEVDKSIDELVKE